MAASTLSGAAKSGSPILRDKTPLTWAAISKNLRIPEGLMALTLAAVLSFQFIITHRLFMIIFAFMYAYILYTVYHLQQNHGRGKKGLSHSDKPFFLVGAPT